MILTAEELARGIVRWDGERIRSVQTRTAFDGWSRPLIDSSGSISESAAFPARQMKINPKIPGEPPGTFEVRWCMLQGSELATWIWRETGEAQVIGAPNVGKFHRIVIATPRLNWDQDSAIIVGDAVVRFSSEVQGEQASPIVEEHFDDGSVFTGELSTIGVKGKFIDIVAPGTQQLPIDEAFTVLGLIALVVGPSAIGEVVLASNIEHVSSGTLHEVEIARDLRMLRPIGTSESTLINQGLQTLENRTGARRGVAVGLRWYEHGVRSLSGVDKLLAFFVGLETVLTATTKANGFKSPIATIVKDERIADLLRPLEVDHGPETLNRLLMKLIDPNPNIIDRASFYQTLRRLDDDFVSEFQQLKRLRDDVMHGKTREVDWQVPGRACKLLESVLRIELRLDHVEAR